MSPAQDRIKASTSLNHAILAWATIVLAACIIAPTSLFVHVLMLDILKVPYPIEEGLPTVISVFGLAVRLITVAALVRLAAPTTPRVSPLVLACIAGFLMLMLNETLRLIFIDGAIMESIPCSITNVAPRAISTFLETAIVAFCAFRRLSWVSLIVVTILVAAMGFVVVTPWLAEHINHWRDLHFASVTRNYQDPYPPKINAIIYTTFIEPTVAAFIVVALCWRQLGLGILRRIIALTLLLLLLRGRVVSLLIFSFWVRHPLPLAFLAEGQFFLETLTLGLLVALAWAWLSPATRLAA